LIASCIKVASTSQDSVTPYYKHHMVWFNDIMRPNYITWYGSMTSCDLMTLY